MASCKDCLHYEICIFHLKGNENEKCIHFKPTADVVEVKRGEWIEDGYYDNPCVCSYCGAEAMHNNRVPKEYIRTPFCPNCGAIMNGGKEE